MLTQWGYPTKGATLKQLKEAFKSDKECEEKLGELISKFGEGARGGLNLLKSTTWLEDVDKERIKSPVFETALSTNRDVPEEPAEEEEFNITISPSGNTIKIFDSIEQTM